MLGLAGAATLALLAGRTAIDAVPAAATVPRADLPSQPPPSTPRAVAFRPFAGGGPASIDESTAAAVQVSAASVPIGAQYASFSAAAAAATPIASALFRGADARGHLLRRATFGARATDLRSLTTLGINRWLTMQLSPSTIVDAEGAAAWNTYPLAGASASTILNRVEDFGWDAMLDTCYASLARQIFSRRQLFEIVVDIFANHLHVSIPGEQWATSPDYVSSVIRANAFGKYSDMLVAAMKHPAMLNYLNNDESRKAHVNENLGRELLELHTVGIAGGYSEHDVKASARILSGRSWQDDLWSQRSTYGAYRYIAEYHWVGPVTVLGFSHANPTGSGGEAAGDAYLQYLAHHPATAQKIARKIAVRFVSDQPSSDLVNRLAAVYLANDTSIVAVVRAVFLSSDFWSSIGTRMRRPLEDAVGAARVLNVTRGVKMREAINWLFWTLDESGHTPFGWVPPNGYPDVAAAWLGAGAMIQRWNRHRSFVWSGFGFGFTVAKNLAPRRRGMTCATWVRQVAQRLLGTPPSEGHVAAILAGADMVADQSIDSNWWKCGRAAALVLDSPYFQLR